MPPGAVADDAGWAALHCAASAGHADIVDGLLGAGADVFATNTTGQLPMHYAASKNHLDCAKRLQGAAGEHGQRMANGTDTSGSTPLLRSSARGYAAMTTWLLEVGVTASSTVAET